MKNLHEIIGWIGTGLILLAYILLSFGILTSGGLSYQIFNLAGAVGIIYSSLAKRDLQPAFLNLIWGFVALFAVFKIIAVK